MAAPTAVINYLWPPGFTEGTDTMNPNQRRITVQIDLVAGGSTDASATQLIDKSDLQGPDGAEPSSIRIDKIEYSVSDGWAVVLQWDHSSSDVTIARLTGQGELCYNPPFNDAGSGGTGDIQYLTAGAATDDSATIIIHATLKA